MSTAPSPGRPGQEPCDVTPGCLHAKGHAGNCSNYQVCGTTGCNQHKGHGGPCDANE